MFKLLGQAMARIFFFKEMREYDNALAEIDKSARAILGLNLDMVERMPVAGVKGVLGSDPALVHSKLYAAGALLKESGEISEIQNDEDESVRLYMKSLSLLIEELPVFEGSDDEKGKQTIDFVIGKLKDYELPIELKRKLAGYFEKIGRYDRSEDIIFEVVDEDAGFVPVGISFYERLLLKSDIELAEGHLPRNEVEDGLAKLRGKLAEK